MPNRVALLRAVNLADHNKISMADLKSFFAELGFSDPRTLLQSGNVIFGPSGSEETDRRDPTEIEELLETESERRLGLRTTYFVRTREEWQRVIDENPFPKEAIDDPSHLVLLALKADPGPEKVNLLKTALTGPEYLHAIGRHLYIVYPAGIGESKLTAAIIEKKLGTSCTGRNWNTVQKALTLLSS